jgi:hypothetical protein
MSREPAGWDPVAGWDDDPAGAAPRWPPAADDPGRSPGVQPRRVARLGLVVAAVAAVAVALVGPGVARDRPVRPAGTTAGAAPERPVRPAGTTAGAARAGGAGSPPAAYTFTRPGGWQDATRQHAPRFPGARPEVVLVGAAGATANLSVVRTRAGPGRPPLASLPTAALRQLQLAGARLVGRARRLSLGGEPAVAADYDLPRPGGRLRARQVACYHRGDLYLVTLTAEAGVFPSSTAAQGQVLRSWRWA